MDTWQILHDLCDLIDYIENIQKHPEQLDRAVSFCSELHDSIKRYAELENRKQAKPEYKWEEINSNTQRLEVYGGWIICVSDDVIHNTDNGMQSGWDQRSAICFVEDLQHKWGLNQ